MGGILTHMHNTDTTGELTAMGFKGKLIEDLHKVITNKESLQELYNFILLRGEGMSKALLVNKFVQYMYDKLIFFTSCAEFIDIYQKTENAVDKKKAISKLLANKTDMKIVGEISKFLENDLLPIEKFYALIVRYRKQYSGSEILIIFQTRYA